jgi:hypothetical protein
LSFETPSTRTSALTQLFPRPGRDFRQAAADATQQALGLDAREKLADAMQSGCLPVSQVSPATRICITAWLYLGVLCGVLLIVVGLAIGGVGLNQQSEQARMVLFGIAVLMVGPGIVWLTLGTLAFSRLKQSVHRRQDAFRERFSGRMTALIGLEQDYEVFRILPDDVGRIHLDRDRGRLLYDGAFYRYVISGSDLDSITPLKSISSGVVRLQGRIVDVEYAFDLVFYPDAMNRLSPGHDPGEWSGICADRLRALLLPPDEPPARGGADAEPDAADLDNPYHASTADDLDDRWS